MTNKRIYNTNAWKTLRRQVLEEENHVCHWCGKKATQVDHLIEIDRDPELALERSNLVASCQPCNSRRGNAYRAKKQAQKRIQRDTPNAGFFGSTNTPTPPPLVSLSPKSETYQNESGQNVDVADLSGQIAPRLVTPTLGHESFGPQVIQWARDHLNLELMPWQQRVLNEMLEHDSDGNLDHRFGLVSVGRQNGKTKGVMAALIGWWLTGRRLLTGEPQQVMSTAHTLLIAEDISKVLFPILEEKFGFKTYTSHGRVEAYLDDIARWRVVSASETSGHGTSNDLIVADEIWKIKRETIEGGLLSTQTARPRPFAFFTSTAGTQESEFFIRWREQGIQQIEKGKPGRLYMIEWSPPPNSDPTEARWWAWANPGLGITITEQELRDKLQFVERGQFIRDHCNQWTSAVGAWIPHGTWEALEVNDDMPAGGVLAVDTDVHDARYCGVRVAPRPDGKLQTKTEFVVESAEAMWEAARVVMEDANVQLALTPGLFALVPLDLSRRTKDFGQREMTTYTAIVRNMILEKKIVHNGQMSLTEQVNRAVSGRVGGTITLSSQKSPGPIEQCRCMVAAAGMAAKPVGNVRKPMIGTAR